MLIIRSKYISHIEMTYRFLVFQDPAHCPLRKEVSAWPTLGRGQRGSTPWSENLHDLGFFCTGVSIVPHLFIPSVTCSQQFALTGGYFTLWGLIQYYFTYCSNCSRLKHWEPFWSAPVSLWIAPSLRFLEHILLIRQDAPDSSGIFPALVLEWDISPRSPGSCH